MKRSRAKPKWELSFRQSFAFKYFVFSTFMGGLMGKWMGGRKSNANSKIKFELSLAIWFAFVVIILPILYRISGFTVWLTAVLIDCQLIITETTLVSLIKVWYQRNNWELSSEQTTFWCFSLLTCSCAAQNYLGILVCPF